MLFFPFQVPNTRKERENIANQYEEKWNFPNCIAAMDGKHIALNVQLKADLCITTNLRIARSITQ